MSGGFRAVRTRSVIAPIGDISIRIHQGELEESLSVKRLSVDRNLPRIIEDSGYAMGG